MSDNRDVHVGLILSINPVNFRKNGQFESSHDCMNEDCVNYNKRISTPYCPECGSKPKSLLIDTMCMRDAFGIFMRRTGYVYGDLLNMDNPFCINEIIVGDSLFSAYDYIPTGFFDISSLDINEIIEHFITNNTELWNDLDEFFGRGTVTVSFGIKSHAVK